MPAQLYLVRGRTCPGWERGSRPAPVVSDLCAGAGFRAQGLLPCPFFVANRFCFCSSCKSSGYPPGLRDRRRTETFSAFPPGVEGFCSLWSKGPGKWQGFTTACPEGALSVPSFSQSAHLMRSPGVRALSWLWIILKPHSSHFKNVFILAVSFLSVLWWPPLPQSLRQMWESVCLAGRDCLWVTSKTQVCLACHSLELFSLLDLKWKQNPPRGWFSMI